jgi:hypothetical protein
MGVAAEMYAAAAWIRGTVSTFAYGRRKIMQKLCQVSFACSRRYCVVGPQVVTKPLLPRNEITDNPCVFIYLSVVGESRVSPNGGGKFKLTAHGVILDQNDKF